LTIGPDNLLYVVDGGDLKPSPPDRGQILKLDLSGKILAKWSRFGNQDGQIYWGHDLAVGKDGAVYVGDVSHGMRVQKFIPRWPLVNFVQYLRFHIRHNGIRVGQESRLKSSFLQESLLSSNTPPALPKPESRAAVVFILITVALDMIAFGIIAPVLPNLIEYFEGGS